MTTAVEPAHTHESHATHGYISDKARYLARLKRIEGQARGIHRMVEEEQYCIDILTQISAMTSALEGVALGLLDDHLKSLLEGGSGVRDGCRRGDLRASRDSSWVLGRRPATLSMVVRAPSPGRFRTPLRPPRHPRGRRRRPGGRPSLDLVSLGRDADQSGPAAAREARTTPLTAVNWRDCNERSRSGPAHGAV